jgi:hypothetical protein
MLFNFIHIYKPIKVVINSFKSKAFKNKGLILTDNEVKYLKNILSIIQIFVKITTKLQAENYPIIYYIIPEVYRIYTRLENFKIDFKVSLKFFLNSFKIIYINYKQDKDIFEAIDKGIAKLRKYYPKTGGVVNKSKAFYISLIFDPRIKVEGLYNIGISSGMVSDIKNRLNVDYER